MQLLRIVGKQTSAGCRAGRTKVNCRTVIQCACLLLVLGVIAEILALNVVLFYIYTTSNDFLRAFDSAPGSFTDKLLASDIIRDAVVKGKNGGISWVMQHTLDRLYVMPVRPQKSNAKDLQAEVYVLGVDVSRDGEALFIYKKILRSRKFPYARLVVDIGANDGLMSSNSYNFIQWGWNAILVEPLHSQLDLAKKNIERYRGLFPKYSQNITFVEAVIGPKDGIERLVLSPDVVKQESHILQSSDIRHLDASRILRVPSMTVRRFSEEYNVPRYFGVLSLDAEGMGDKILHQWINLNFRPAYIIYESLHNSEPFEITLEYLEAVGYACIAKRGWNYIFEYNRTHL